MMTLEERPAKKRKILKEIQNNGEHIIAKNRNDLSETAKSLFCKDCSQLWCTVNNIPHKHCGCRGCFPLNGDKYKFCYKCKHIGPIYCRLTYVDK